MKRFQETKQDFGYQYIQFHDVLMKDYFNSIEKINPEFLKYKGCSIKGIIEKSIFAKFIYYQPLRDRFNEFWKNGGMPNHLKEQYYNDAYAEFIHNEMELVAELKNEKNETKFDDKVKKKLENALDPCKGKIIYYAYNLRFLELALPILSKIPEEVIVLTYQDIPESSNYPENIMLVEFPVIKMRTCKNVFLKLKFPELYHLFYNLEMLLKIIEPKSIIILEGFNVVEYNILAVIGKAQKIKTVCVQHGWPGILYSGFHNMQFDYFLSWGKSFTNLLKPNNPDPKFITVGYPYSVPLKVQEKNSISFFFQGPYFVSTSAVIEEMISFAIFCATTFPEFDILLREHPTSTIRTKRMDLLNSFENIKFVSHNKISLSDVLKKSIFSVSVFSSTLMESIAYNSIPFIFNLTSMPNYYPNLQEMALGIEIKTIEEAQIRIKELLESDIKLEILRKNMSNCKSDYFECTGNEAIERAANEILKISNGL